MVDRTPAPHVRAALSRAAPGRREHAANGATAQPSLPGAASRPPAPHLQVAVQRARAAVSGPARPAPASALPQAIQHQPPPGPAGNAIQRAALNWSAQVPGTFMTLGEANVWGRPAPLGGPPPLGGWAFAPPAPPPPPPAGHAAVHAHPPPAAHAPPPPAAHAPAHAAAAAASSAPVREGRAAPPPSARGRGARRGGKGKILSLGEFLGPRDDTAAFAALGAAGEIDSHRVTYSQFTCGSQFQESFELDGATISGVNDLAVKLHAKPALYVHTPPIRILLFKGRIMSIDNRRLYAHKRAGVRIRFTKVDIDPASHPNVDPEAPADNINLR